MGSVVVRVGVRRNKEGFGLFFMWGGKGRGCGSVFRLRF